MRELEKHSVVDATNKDEVVEHLRMMSELIIWGDQNNSSVLDYCLEKNVLQVNPRSALCRAASFK